MDPGGPATNVHIHNHTHGHTDHPIKTKRLCPETDTLTPCHQTSRRTSTPWLRPTSTRESEKLRVGHTVKTHSSHRYIAPPSGCDHTAFARGQQITPDQTTHYDCVRLPLAKTIRDNLGPPSILGPPPIGVRHKTDGGWPYLISPTDWLTRPRI